MALTLDIGANTRDAVKGIGQISDALEDNQDALKDLAKDAKHSSDTVSKELTGAAKDGEKAADKLDDKFSAAMRDISKDSKRATDDVADNAHKGFGKASESVGTFKEEAIQNFSETASSFDGTAQGIADGVQGTFGGLASSLPLPFGIAAGAIGLIFGGVLQNIADATAATKQQIEDAFSDMIQSGNDFVSQDFFNKALEDVLNDDGKTAKAKKYADALGLPYRTVIGAMAGIPEEAAAVTAAVNAQNEKLAASAENAGKGYKLANDRKIKSNNDFLAAVGQQGDAIDKAASKFRTYAAESDKAAASVDKVKKSTDQLPSLKNVTVTADTSGAEQALDRFISKARKVTISAKVQDRYGRDIF